MKNKRFLLGILAIALALSLTAVGCDNVQIVAFERADAVSEVNVNYTPFSTPISQPDPVDLPERSGIYVGWVPPKNAVSYNVYVEYVEYFGGMHLLATTKSPSWSRGLHKTDASGYPSDLDSSVEVRFGITAEDFDGNHVASDIVWSKQITVPRYWRAFLD